MITEAFSPSSHQRYAPLAQTQESSQEQEEAEDPFAHGCWGGAIV